MLYIKKDRLKDLEKYGFHGCYGTWAKVISSKFLGRGSELTLQLIVGPWEDNSPTNDRRLISNAYMWGDGDDAETMDAPSEDETRTGPDVIYDMIRDGVVEKRRGSCGNWS